MAYVTTLVVMTMSGIAQGLQPLAAYFHGLGDKSGGSYLLKLALKTALLCSAGWFLIMEMFPGAFVSLFIDRAAYAELHAATARALRIYSISYIFIGVNVVAATYFSAVERPLYGIALSIGRGVLVAGAALFVMSSLMGATGIWLAPVVSEAACAGIAAVSFVWARRKKKDSRLQTPFEQRS
jgi:Na+-driven multidrug efflux pump